MTSKIVCKICIAQKGLKGKDLFEGKCSYAFDNQEDFVEHLKKIHQLKVGWSKSNKGELNTSKNEI